MIFLGSVYMKANQKISKIFSQMTKKMKTIIIKAQIDF